MQHSKEPIDVETEKAAVVKETKGCLWRLSWILVLPPLLLALLLAYPFAIAPLRNDLAAERLLEDLLADVELPAEAVIVETAAWAGNSSGTGNHVELWAGLLIRYDGPEETAPGTTVENLRDWAAGYMLIPNTADAEELFPALAELDEWNGCYILGTYGDAVTQWDIRGH